MSRTKSPSVSTSRFTELLDDQGHFSTSPQSDVRLEDVLATSIAEALAHGRGMDNAGSPSGSSSTDSGAYVRQGAGDHHENKDSGSAELKRAKGMSWIWKAGKRY